MSSYPKLPDKLITDWYAGAWLESERSQIDAIDEWIAGDACVAIGDGWLHDSGEHHNQLVIYVVDHDDFRTLGASAEINRRDARLIVNRLTEWLKSTNKGRDA